MEQRLYAREMSQPIVTWVRVASVIEVWSLAVRGVGKELLEVDRRVVREESGFWRRVGEEKATAAEGYPSVRVAADHCHTGAVVVGVAAVFANQEPDLVHEDRSPLAQAGRHPCICRKS